MNYLFKLTAAGERVTCEECDGTGMIYTDYFGFPDDEEPCEECGGTGFELAYGRSTACSIKSMADLREWQRKELGQ
jgi:DnaJ-class molecular chaperone